MKYFLHDTSAFSDEKITMLYMKFGYEGIGLFYTILERIAQQEKPIAEDVLKVQLNIKKRLEKQLHFMYEIDILSVKNGQVFNENILNFSEKYQIKKEKTRKRVSEWRDKQKDTENVTSYNRVSNARKVKESKVNESKVNSKKENTHTKEEYYTSFDHLKLSIKEYDKLIAEGYKKEQIDSILLDIKNYRQNTKYKSLNLTVRKWLKNETSRLQLLSTWSGYGKQTAHTINGNGRREIENDPDRNKI